MLIMDQQSVFECKIVCFEFLRIFTFMSYYNNSVEINFIQMLYNGFIDYIYETFLFYILTGAVYKP